VPRLILAAFRNRSRKGATLVQLAEKAEDGRE
jgi:hypothetical protein